MISAAEEIKKLERQKKGLEKLVELENDMNEKEKEFLKSKEKYETQLNKHYETFNSNENANLKEVNHE